MILFRRRAFTLLELIVVLVVLALLAALAVPTFASVLSRSRDAVTLSTLRAVARDSQALAALDSSSTVRSIDVTTAASETSTSGAGARDVLSATDISLLSATRSKLGYTISSNGAVLALRPSADRICAVGVNRTVVSVGTCKDVSAITSDSFLSSDALVLPSSSSSDPEPTPAPIPTTVDLLRTNDGDANGLVYYLGTKSRTAAFANPAGNALTVTSLNAFNANTPPSLSTDRSTGPTNPYHSTNTAGSWVRYSLPVRHGIDITSYSLKDRNDSNSNNLVNFKLQGSNDYGSTWEDIDMRTPLSAGSPVRGAWRSFTAPSSSASYSDLRILSTGVDSSSGNYLIFDEIEFYGTLETAGSVRPPATPSITSIIPTDGTLTVDFPATPGALDHQVQVTAGTTTKKVQGSGPITVTGLENGRSYQVTLVASNTSGTSTSATVTATPIRNISFNHVSDGDANGLVYYLGTKSRTAAFANPAGNALTVTSLNAFNANTPPSLSTDRSTGPTNPYHSTNTAGSWVRYDLPPGSSISVSAYSLKNRTDSGTNIPRNFTLQGSNDGGVTWSNIDVRTTTNSGSTSINTWRTFAVGAGSPSYSTVRLLSTGVDSSGGNYLIFDEIEFYGSSVIG